MKICTSQITIGILNTVLDRTGGCSSLVPALSKSAHVTVIKYPSDSYQPLVEQCCLLSQIIGETPYLLVSRLESDIFRIIAKVVTFCRLDFLIIKFQIFCVVIFLDFHSTKQGLPLVMLILGHVALTKIKCIPIAIH